MTNCTLKDNVAVYWGGGVYNSELVSITLRNCTLNGNLAYNGGGAAGSGSGRYEFWLYDCVLTNNVATNSGGGAYSCALSNCIVAFNSAALDGGGACGVSLYTCMLSSNTAVYGGGAAAASLQNCTLIGNSASYVGGGAANHGVFSGWCILNNCVLIGNTAEYGGGVGSGDVPSQTFYPVLNSCVLTGNSASRGGASYYAGLKNCTLTGNSAAWGGGAYRGGLTNCIVYYNTAPTGSNYSAGTLNYCSTMPLAAGIGNFTNEPLFVDYASGNLRLQSNSPCINAGNNTYITNSTDLDGNPRIVAGTVDMGAYEQQSPALLPFFSWLESYGLPTYAYADSDNDRMNDWQEWRCGTVPTNALSLLRLLMPESSIQNLASRTLTWESVTNRSYFLERGTNLANAELGTGNPEFSLVATNIPGHASTTSYTDTNTAGSRVFFYRVGVEE